MSKSPKMVYDATTSCQQISARQSRHSEARPEFRQLVTRVAETIRNWGIGQGYFKTPKTAPPSTTNSSRPRPPVGRFNSPVWFNVGCDRIEPNSDARNWHWNPQTQQVEFGVTGYSTPQCFACFITRSKIRSIPSHSREN